MQNAKLIEVLATLTKEEWLACERYLLMHTKEKTEIFQLFVILQKKKNNLHSLGELEEFRIKYFTHQSNKGLANIMAKLYQILKSFLADNEMRLALYDEDLYLLKSMNRRGLFDQANYIANKMEDSISADMTLDIEKSSSLVKLHHTQHYSNNPMGKASILKLSNSLMTAYLELAALYGIELINMSAITKSDYSKEIDILEKFSSMTLHSELTDLLNSIKSVFKQEDIFAFEKVADAFLNARFANGSEVQNIVANYMEILSRKLFMKGKINDVKLVTKIQLYSLELAAKLETDRISPGRFQNMVGTLSYINTFEWTKKFIDKWIAKVDTKHYEANRDLAYAQNCFYHEKYADIVKYTNHSTYDTLQKFRALALRLIGLYYIRYDEYNVFLDSYTNMKSLLNRNKNSLGATTYTGILNLSNIIFMLSKGNYGNVRDALSSNQNILYRSWVEKEIKK